MDALITGKMLTWAIKRANETQNVLAFKLKTTPETITAWEKEEERPSIRQAEELAKKLEIPLGYLYISTPPIEKMPLPDLRTISNHPTSKPSPKFLEVIYDALRKRDWYQDYLKNEGADILTFIDRFKITDNPSDVALSIQNTLHISDTLRKQAHTWDEYLTLLITKAEEARIIVLRTGIVGNNTYRKLDVNEFRGFAISDNLAPIVFINENDYKTAQIFTLVHELAHLWIGESGVSNPDYTLNANQQTHKIDQFCDKVAAEVLVPKDNFDLRWDTTNEIDENIRNLARYYRVSPFVILRRAYTLDKIPNDIYHEKYQSLLSNIKTKHGKEGGNYYNLVMSRNSPTLTKRILVSIAENKVLPNEAAKLLNMKIVSLYNVGNYFMGGLENA